jgi:type II secretory pathway component HofQ
MRLSTRLPIARAFVLLGGVAMLSACGGTSLFNRDRPDEMAVSRQPPLVIPPDFALTPPAPGTAAAQQSNLQQQALEAMFGGTAPRSAAETSALRQAGRSLAEVGIRSSVGDTETQVIDKGTTTQDIVAAPEGDGQFARVAAGGGQ